MTSTARRPSRPDGQDAGKRPPTPREDVARRASIDLLLVDLPSELGPFVAGIWQPGQDCRALRDPEDGQNIATVGHAGNAELEQALVAAERSLDRPWSAHERSSVLRAVAAHVDVHRERFAQVIAREGIKTIREARSEARRCALTLALSADAALRAGAQSSTAADVQPETVGWSAATRRQPVGIVAAITPFNDPLNLVAHKLGPALAAGNAVVLKPHEQTPLSALLLAQAFEAAGLPAGRLSVLPAPPEIAKRLVSDPRARLINFTGGRRVAERIVRSAGVRRVLLELGGVCPTIVLDDADVAQAAPLLVDGAFAAAGQNCLHVQRVLIARPLYSELRDAVVAHTDALQLLPKLDEASDVGPLVSTAAVARVQEMVSDACARGARLLRGGGGEGTRYAPTLLDDVPEAAAVLHQEVFGPVTVLEPFDRLDEAIERANALGGGIHAGVLTDRRADAERLVGELDFGGVVVGGTSDRRLDGLPFGGTGLAGVGREGVDAATAAMSELKTVLTI
jgi:glyceraldehyde-3-phosphate dehydrogenase (NADP+)